MKCQFIETKEFQSRWVNLGLADDDLRELQAFLLEHSNAGPVMQGTGGVRKLRWARKGKGKSGGVRVIYFDAYDRETIWLITMFGKNEKVNLSQEERNTI